ncbi:MAG: carbamate kinase [Pseudomonadales bacterium]|nr:carbamate kinase [Pseudomonadales bacterium]
MRIVIALGGNALLKKNQPPEAEIQRKNIISAAQAIADIADDNELVITHGNGPQIGLLAIQAENYREVEPYPLDILNAESEGMLGYQIEQALINTIPEREVVTVLTQVLVDEKDEAFQNPSKPIGTFYPSSEKSRLEDQYGWDVVETSDGLRRVVASPQPRQILELPAISLLIEHGMIVICNGGGGIPVVRDRSGNIRGVAAVIDKDLSSALLARILEADMLLLLTDVDGVYSHWGEDHASLLPQATVDELHALSFEAGTMGPKVAAACAFAEATGKYAYIGHLNKIAEIIEGQSGSKIMLGAKDQ